MFGTVDQVAAQDLTRVPRSLIVGRGAQRAPLPALWLTEDAVGFLDEGLCSDEPIVVRAAVDRAVEE